MLCRCAMFCTRLKMMLCMSLPKQASHSALDFCCSCLTCIIYRSITWLSLSNCAQRGTSTRQALKITHRPFDRLHTLLLYRLHVLFYHNVDV